MREIKEKRLWRQRCRAVREAWTREVDPRLVKVFERLLEEVETGTVGIFWPIGSEPDLRPAALRWCGNDPLRRLAIPSVEEAGMRYRLWRREVPLTTDRAGLTVPDAEVVAPDLIFAPALPRDIGSVTVEGILTAFLPKAARADAFSSPRRRRGCPRRFLRRMICALTH